MSDPFFLMVKALSAKLVETAGGQNTAAEIIGRTQGMISNYISKDMPHILNATQVILLTKATGNADLLEYMYEQAQATFEKPTVNEGAALFQKLAKVQKETAEFVTVVMAALANGDLTVNDVQTMIKEGQEAIAEIRQMMDMASTFGGTEISKRTESST